MNKPEFVERLNYIVTEDSKYVGQLVNMQNIIVQADSLEELEQEAKVSMKVALELLNEGYNLPFNKVKQTHREFLKHKLIKGDCDQISLQDKITFAEKYLKKIFDADKEIWPSIMTEMYDEVAQMKSQIK